MNVPAIVPIQDYTANRAMVASATGMFWGTDSVGGGLKVYLPANPAEAEKKAKFFAGIDNTNSNSSKTRALGLSIPTQKKTPYLLNKVNPGGKTVQHPSYQTEEGDQSSAMIMSPVEAEAAARMAAEELPVAPPQLERTLAHDPITAALTAPSNPSDNYFNVLRALVAAVRTALVPKSLVNGGIFQAPNETGAAFPSKVKDEDPDYFWLLEAKQREEAYKNSDYVKGARKAYAAVGDQLVYAFDRRNLPTMNSIASGASMNGPARERNSTTKTKATTKNPKQLRTTGSTRALQHDVVAPGEHIRIGEYDFRNESSAALLTRQGRISMSRQQHPHHHQGKGNHNDPYNTYTATTPTPTLTNNNNFNNHGMHSHTRELEDNEYFQNENNLAIVPFGATIGGGGGGGGDYSTSEAIVSHHHHHPQYHQQNHHVNTEGSSGTTTMIVPSNIHYGGYHRPVTVQQATGNVAVGAGAGGTSGGALQADAATDSLRWAEQQRIDAEHRRARCEHVLHLLQREMAAEARRQVILRKSAAKFAASEARFRGLEWESYAVGVDDPPPKIKGEAGDGWNARSGLDPKERTKGLQYRSFAEAGTLAGKAGGGTGRFKATDLAQVRYEAARERAESADGIMRILEDYRLIPLSVAAGYLTETLTEVDKMYAELVGARAQEAGQTLSAAEIAQHLHEVRQDADKMLAEEMEGYSDGDYNKNDDDDSEEGYTEHLTAKQRSRLGFKKKKQGVVLPSQFYVKNGGAEAMQKHDDVVEVKKFGAAHGGLSSFNLRPFTAREVARDVITKGTQLPGLDDGFADGKAEALAGLPNGGHHVIAGVGKRGMAAIDVNSPYASSLSRNGRAGGGGGAGGLSSHRRLQSSGSGGGGSSIAATRSTHRDGNDGSGNNHDDDTVDYQNLERALDGDTKAPSKEVVPGAGGLVGNGKNEEEEIGKPPKKPPVPEWMRNVRKKKTTTTTSHNNDNKPKTAMDEVLASGPLPVMYHELDETLKKWQEGSRPSWQQQVLKSYDLSNMRESTSQMLGIIQRTAKEPPDGRYSHLMGRYVSADILREQLAASRALEAQEKANRKKNPSRNR